VLEQGFIPAPASLLDCPFQLSVNVSRGADKNSVRVQSSGDTLAKEQIKNMKNKMIVICSRTWLVYLQSPQRPPSS
jgi:hypothetical protein